MTAARAGCRRRRRLAVVFVVSLLAGCASSRPPPTPADTQVIFEELARRGGTITSVVGGDPGCDEAELVDNAIGFDLRGPDERDAARVHLLIFRNAAAYDAAETAFERCYRDLSGSGGVSVERFGASPYRFIARGLSEAERRMLEEAIEALR